MKNVALYAHNPNSEGAKELAEVLQIKRIKLERSNYIPGPGKTIINWGSSSIPDTYSKSTVLNNKVAVGLCTNKLRFFQKVKDNVRVVPATSDIEEVKTWLKEGHTVCARTILQGSGGAGLVLFDSGQDFVQAPLWTKYIKKRDEFRIHVMGENIISAQRKALRSDKSDFADVDHRVRNLANGYIFARNNITLPEDVKTQAVAAVKAVGLDFGAVDVIWNEKSKQSYVLEINTAPGLQGSTIVDYTEAFAAFIGNKV